MTDKTNQLENDMAEEQDESRAAFERWWCESRLKTWLVNSHPQWPNAHTEENMPEDWGSLFKRECEEAWQACARTLARPVGAGAKGGAALYNAVNAMMCELGAAGEIDTRHRLVTAVMDALHDVDGGTYKQLAALSIGVDLLEDSEAPADYLRGFNDCLRAVAEQTEHPAADQESSR